MSQNRTKTLLAAWILAFLAAAPAFGQGLQDMQMFAPADLSTYGGGPRPNEGFFFGFDGLIWSRGAPKTTTIGFEGATRSVIMWEQDPPAPNPLDRERVVQANTQNTGVLKSEPEGGQRYELGYVNGHHGWMTSILKLSDHSQEFMASDVGVVFSDPPFGSQPLHSLQGFIDTGLTTVDDLAVIFDQVTARNVIETWGVELNYIYRMHPCARGGILEILLGARYLEFDEAFNVEALGGNLLTATGTRWQKTTSSGLKSASTGSGKRAAGLGPPKPAASSATTPRTSSRKVSWAVCWIPCLRGRRR